MDIEADNLVEGIDTSKDGKVVLVFGALALGFVLRMRSQNRH